jgi:hypothetical protein
MLVSFSLQAGFAAGDPRSGYLRPCTHANGQGIQANVCIGYLID